MHILGSHKNISTKNLTISTKGDGVEEAFPIVYWQTEISESNSFLSEEVRQEGESELFTYYIQTISTKCSTFLNSGSPVTKIALSSTAEARTKQSA